MSSRGKILTSNLKRFNITPFEVAIAFFFIAALTIVTFWGHLIGIKTFPWDFIGGYHFQSFAWYFYGNFFSPPNWFPWGDMGFPAALAIQGGAWYLPIALLDWLGLTYTIEVATRIQVFHVGIGSLGMYMLLRIFGFKHLIAIFGSICFFFSSGFYSNQQHVDIIRGYALIPWLMWFFHPSKLLNNNNSVPFAAIILLWQFFISSYPGVIVSSAYALSLYFFLNCIQTSDRRILIRYFFTVSMVVLIALLLSTLKWVPFFWNYDLYGSTSIDTYQKAPFSPHHFLTFIFPYDVEFLSSDVTMRSLYLPLVGLLGIFFIANSTAPFLCGLLFIVITFIFGVFPSSSAFLSDLIPGSRLSRFPLSDWRPFLHIGIIILCCEGWRAFFLNYENSFYLKSRLVWMLCMFAIFAWIAKDVGYSNSSILKPVLWSVCICALLICYVGIRRQILLKSVADSVLSNVVFVVLILASIFQGFEYHSEQSRVWSADWNSKISRQLFGIEKISEPNTATLSARPERMVVGAGVNEIIKNKNSSLYNKCWYEGGYCLFGYNNLKLSAPHSALLESLLSKAEGDNILKFISGAQGVMIFELGQQIKFDKLIANHKGYGQAVLGVTVEPLSYTADKVVYRISTPRGINIVENEMWWKGWMVKQCNERGCMDLFPSTPTSNYLRSWTVPAGNWIVELEFQPGGVLLSRILALLGLLLMASWSVFGFFIARKRSCSV